MAKSSAVTKTTPKTSLLDFSECKVREWYLVYHARPPWFWWAKYLKQGFRHVELTRPVYFGPGPEDVVWLNILPTFELLDAEISTDPRPPWVKCPNSTVQKVTTLQPLERMRSWFDIGPPTCVEVVKAALGIRAFCVRTPWQLFQHIQQRGGIIDGRRRR
ncbi:MAG TPA: hypothetical protein VGW33_14300 [Terriglobia bacterium]|nr:hypothetical protein [Terriglobia bacterium]